jgi:hypothetical protein
MGSSVRGLYTRQPKAFPGVSPVDFVGAATLNTCGSMTTYEEQLDARPDWALLQGSMHFDEKSAVHQSLHKIAKRLEDLGIPYAIVGGMALFAHRVRRFTEDVDVLVTAEGLRAVHEQLEGLGYVPPFPNSKQLRDTETGVRIEFLVTGQYPGDGKPKPLAFPEPTSASVEINGIRYLQLEKLVELKLASGMTTVTRAKDIGDVVEMIRLLNLSAEFGLQLDEYVRDKYGELWQAIHEAKDFPDAPG